MPLSDTPSPAVTPAIPPVTGQTLTGTPVSLPADLHGRTGVLILGFSKDSRLQARAWGKRLAGDFYTSSQVQYFEMPMLAGVPRLLRGYVLRQIAAEVSDRGKPHFLPITNNEDRWRSLVHYAQPNTPYVVVVDSTGHPLWQTSGDATDAAYAQLRTHLPTPSR